MVVRGVPYRIAKDAWWLDDAEPPKGVRAAPLLIVALLLADLLFWGVRPGVGFAIWIGVMACAVALRVFRGLTPRRLCVAGAILILAVLPLIEVVQFGTVTMALFGLLTFAIFVTTDGLDHATLLRAVRRLPGYGLVQTCRDAFAIRRSVPKTGSFRNVLFDWALPVVVGGVFLILLIAANPMVDRWVLAITRFDQDIFPDGERVFFWGFIVIAIWPLLRVTEMLPALIQAKPSGLRGLRSDFVNERSVQRALITFNLIFAVQTVLDIGYLWGGVALPEGMTYAQYAHRGAYPLLATAVMAGLFALMSQPYLGTRPEVRVLLYFWIAQTIVLVISSILRLDLYVDVYGLTRLRFAAFIWMIVVALGLILIIMQMMGRQTIGWFTMRAFGLGMLAIYLCNLVNIDGYIARHNLADDRDNDHYLCELSEGAIPAIRAHEAKTGEELCYSYRPYLSQRDDWREWGYRNARLHRSLAAMENAQ
jgi:hypothetical protein